MQGDTTGVLGLDWLESITATNGVSGMYARAEHGASVKSSDGHTLFVIP